MQSDYIKHHGIRGQKWGIRRFQNKDGSLKPAGEKRYGNDSSDKKSKSESSTSSAGVEKKKGLSDKQKKALKVGAAVLGTTLAAYGGYKLYQAVEEKTIQSKKLTTEQLKSMGISVFEPERIKIDRVKVDRTPIDTFKPTSVNNIKGNQTFNKAAKANDDLVNDLLKKNGKALAKF